VTRGGKMAAQMSFGGGKPVAAVAG